MASRKRRRVGDDTVPSWAYQARRVGGAEAEPHVPSGPRAVPNWADQNIAQIQAAEKLWNFILLLYSMSRIFAKDVCILAHYIDQCGVPGKFADYGLPPDLKETGHYQRHLDRFLLTTNGPRDWHPVEVPTYKKKRRTTRKLWCKAPHDCLNAEYEALNTPTTAEESEKVVSEAKEWGHIYRAHPAVTSRAAHEPPVQPVALYLDDVKYTRQ